MWWPWPNRTPQPGKRQPRSRWWSARRIAGGIVRVRAATSTARPSRPCCITTRLASHAMRRDVSYETSPASGRLFRECDVVAELFEAPDVMTADACGVAALEVVGPEVVVSDTVLEHVPEGNNHRVLHGDDSLLRAAPRFEPVVERAVITLLTSDGGPSGLLEGRPQPGGTLTRRRALPLPRALVIAGT